MPFPDITVAPGTSHDDLLDKLQRFFVSAMKYWKNEALLDWSITSPKSNDILIYNASTGKWTNSSLLNLNITGPF